MLSIPHWSILNKIQDVKIIKSTYVWLLIVPLFSKFLSKIENTLTLNISGNSYVFDMQLPFSWKLLFFTALSFTTANIIYITFSPKIIKDQNDFGEFQSQGKGIDHLHTYMNTDEKEKFDNNFEKAYKVLKKNLRKSNRRNGGSPFKTDPDTESTLTEKQKSEFIQSYFWEIYNLRNSSNKVARSIIVFLYTLGFLGLTYIIFKNIQWVVQQL